MAELGVNIDHVATVRQARRANEPDPVWAAAAAQIGGADCITLHLREDRRHIQDRDLHLLKATVTCKLNLELACEPSVLELACQVRPEQVTLVPERREEVTTEGGLDCAGQESRVGQAIQRLRDAGIIVSLFIDPDPRQLDAAQRLGAEAVELHTGAYAHAQPGPDRRRQLALLAQASAAALAHGLTLHSGHGLTYHNVEPIARIPGMGELNIGHSIVARALFVGFTEATREMKRLIREAAAAPVHPM